MLDCCMILNDFGDFEGVSCDKKKNDELHDFGTFDGKPVVVDQSLNDFSNFKSVSRDTNKNDELHDFVAFDGKPVVAEDQSMNYFGDFEGVSQHYGHGCSSL